MKFTTSLSSLFVLLLAQQALASPLTFGSGVAVGGKNGAAAPPGQVSSSAAAASSAPAKAASSAPAAASSAPAKAASTAAAATAVASAAAPPAASASAAASSSAAPAQASSAASNSSDPQSSLTLDPKVIATGFENDGQDVPTAGQVASLTSSNNFINFCLTVPNLPITNGLQVKTGSCNPAPMGVIAATTNMPSSKFQFPTNGDTIQSNTPFTISMAISHLETGFFVNANENYFAAPQFVNGAGDIQGHSHVVIELLTALDQTAATDPTRFAFFKGLNDKAANGVLTADVTNGLPAGVYRLASINTAANHQPVLVAVAQHGSLDDMVYFTVADNATATAATPAAIKGANTGGKPGVQGGFAQPNKQNNNNNNNQNKAQQNNNNQKNAQQNNHGNNAIQQPGNGFRGGFFGGGFKVKRNALNRM
ncbi:hypothetical protein EIP91_010156 [Steccherinum ochraceum]|uniref:Uncharacterized protein n=1 Tax=Steccherinum ochraceum TaxID=92696 RepID=A0A4R0RRC9_9APHY|nr:hypothetical protein EIP91_010156 [Steccherinum ochraceum]